MEYSGTSPWMTSFIVFEGFSTNRSSRLTPLGLHSRRGDKTLGIGVGFSYLCSAVVKGMQCPSVGQFDSCGDVIRGEESHEQGVTSPWVTPHVICMFSANHITPFNALTNQRAAATKTIPLQYHFLTRTWRGYALFFLFPSNS